MVIPLFTHCSFINNKNKHDSCRYEDSVKKFCANLKKHVTEKINSEKKRSDAANKKKKKLYQKQKFCHTSKEAYNGKVNEMKNIVRSLTLHRKT